MKTILIAALVGAAIAGVIVYLNDPEKVNDVIDDLKDSANDAYNKVKKQVIKGNKMAESAVS